MQPEIRVEISNNQDKDQQVCQTARADCQVHSLNLAVHDNRYVQQKSQCISLLRYSEGGGRSPFAIETP